MQPQSPFGRTGNDNVQTNPSRRGVDSAQHRKGSRLRIFWLCPSSAVRPKDQKAHAAISSAPFFHPNSAGIELEKKSTRKIILQ
jgi:hypothetical protein